MDFNTFLSVNDIVLWVKKKKKKKMDLISLQN